MALPLRSALRSATRFVTRNPLSLLKVAQQHADTVVPSYTKGVQAMPISMGHYLLAYADSFARDAERIRQAWPRIDRSALGTAVLANSSWPLDRQRLVQRHGL